MKKTEIYKRLYKDYSKKYLNKIILSAFYSILVAGSTSGIAWLLDPAIKKLFIEKINLYIINTLSNYHCFHRQRFFIVSSKSNYDQCWRINKKKTSV